MYLQQLGTSAKNGYRPHTSAQSYFCPKIKKRDMDPNERVRVNLVTRDLRIEPFKPTNDRLLTGRAWQEWVENLERQFRFFKIGDISDRKDALLIFGGQEITCLNKWLPDPSGKLDDYEKVKKKLNDYYVPKINKHYARYTFMKMRPRPKERIITYWTLLREQAFDCEFNESCDDRILEHLIQTVRNSKLIQKCIKKEWTLFKFLEEAQKSEEISEQISSMWHWQAKYTACRRKKQSCQDTGDALKTCGYCGLYGVHPKGWACPAFGKRCYRCHKIDHFAVACRTKLYSRSDFNSHYKYKHEIICRGNKTETNKLDKTDSLYSNIGPKMVGHLIVNHLKRNEEFEAVHHTEKRDILMESLPGRGSGQDLAGQSTIRNRHRGSRLTDKEHETFNQSQRYPYRRG